MSPETAGVICREIHGGFSCQGKEYFLTEELATPGSFEFLMFAGSGLVCVVLAALAAGMTMGFLSIDPLDLAIKKRAVCSTNEDVQNKYNSERVAPLVSKHHLLLVTLLLLNSIANEALPIFLDHLVPPYIAVLLSVTLVLIFGEIIPSAIFTGKHQLRLAAAMSPLVWFFVVILFPISWPISKFLDCCLGHEGLRRFKRSELKAIINIQSEDQNRKRASETGIWSKALEISSAKKKSNRLTKQMQRRTIRRNQLSQKLRKGSVLQGNFDCGTVDHFTMNESIISSPRRRRVFPKTPMKSKLSEMNQPTMKKQHSFHGFNIDEVKILHGALEMRSRTAADVLIPWDDVFMLNENEELDHTLAHTILDEGHSRVPVYSETRTNVCGIVLIKELLTVNCSNPATFNKLSKDGDIEYRLPVICTPEISLLHLLNEFQKGQSHMAFVATNDDAAKTLVFNINNKFTKQRNERNTKDESVVYPPNRADDILGIVCLEDLIEVLIQEDIWDESDQNWMQNPQILRFNERTATGRTTSSSDVTNDEILRTISANSVCVSITSSNEVTPLLDGDELSFQQ